MLTKKKKFKKSESWQAIFFSLFLGALLAATIGFLAVSIFKINKKRTELNIQISQLKKEVQALEEKNKELKAGMALSEKDAYWEEKIREQGYKKPGEEVAVVLPAKETPAEPQKPEKSFWQKLLDSIKSFF